MENFYAQLLTVGSNFEQPYFIKNQVFALPGLKVNELLLPD